ncbi:unnamed protein product [Clonostachys rosea f. rosea IK726]|jgi:hypothetical protein|uniref:Uncharacterized protein n=2 Tax=Bionectria ochroleuca TaxID=29856 RepID=A0A8H7NBN9_BIOOC|nr:unnamed protein product [Clonostachys rosea f. rosea IK726]
MVAITQLLFTGLSALLMVRNVGASYLDDYDGLALRDISNSYPDEVFYEKRHTGKLPKPILKAGRAALKVGHKLPGPVKKHIKNAAGGAINGAVKASFALSKKKNQIKKKFKGKRDVEELSHLIAREIMNNPEIEHFLTRRATGKLPKPIIKAGRAAIKVGHKLPGPVKKHAKAAANGVINKVVKGSMAVSKKKSQIKKKLGGKRDLAEDYDVEVRDYDDEISWE